MNNNKYKEAQVLSERTLAFIENHELTPSPVNYSVIFLYASNHTELKLTIEKQLSSKGQIDDTFIEAMYNEYLSETSNIENIILSPLESTLNKTLNKIDTQVVNEKEITLNLEKVDSALNKLSHNKPLKALISFIKNLMNTSQGQRKTLTDELTQTYAEVKLLRSQLNESKEQAALDALTGLLNRRGWQSKLQDFDLDQVHSTIAIDIDHFKRINDGFGHAVGDKVIQLIANVIKKSITTNDIAARIGGEEFVIVVKNKSTTFAESIAEKIRTSVEKLRLVQKHNNTSLPPISVSLGVAELSERETWDSLFERADKAMYQAKQQGRNRCIISPDYCLA
ncbi:MAG: GGDEF domain-containing protein [Thalassotalea sp.]